MLKLTIEDDEGKTTVIPVIRDEMTIGRQEGNTIRLTERNVSRRHARLLRQNGVVYVEDLASFTGVKLNGAKISAMTPIREGDELLIGDYKIVLKTDRPADGVVAASAGAAAPAAAVGAGPPATKPRSTRTATPAMGSRTTPAAAATSVTAPAPAAGAPAASAEPATPRKSVPEPLEAQPTIPVRTLGEMADKADGAAPAPARLVVLTTELAGMEFMLGRASVVIGRTDENDVQLNHRSISRHHAKIVRDGDRYTIVDLQSANGVRVNGDDYERIELNPGDIVELGHVKMRFVGPFELYVFDPAAAAKMGERKVPSKIVFTVAGAVLSLVLLIVVQKVGHQSKASGEATAAAAPGAGENNAAPAMASQSQAAAAAAVPTPGSSFPTVVPAGTGAAAPVDPFAKITRDEQNEDWVGALATIRQLNAGGPTQAPLTTADRARLLELFRRAETERKGSAAYAKFDEASTAKDYGGAIDWYEAIPADSIYKKRAAGRYQEARSLFVSEHLLAAEKFRTLGKCVETRREADEIAKVDPANQLIKELVKLCKPQAGGTLVAAAATLPRTPRGRAAGAPAASAKEPATAHGDAPATPPARAGREAHAEAAQAAAPEPAPDPDFLLKQAREAWLHQQCGTAIDIARRALKAKPTLTDAYQIITVCSCSLRDAEGAGRAYGKLDDKNRNMARTICQKSGISLGGE